MADLERQESQRMTIDAYVSGRYGIDWGAVQRQAVPDPQEATRERR